MEQLSFFEKLGVLGSNILAHPLFILLLLSPIVIIALNKKITKKFIIAIYIAIILVVLFVGNATLFSLLDNMIDGLFMVLYFPNFITLFIVVVVSAIIMLITFLRKKMLKVNKVINITGFAIVQTIFCLILIVVQSNEIDIYEENALYTNSDVLTLMQLLMGAFALQILGILIFTAIEKITEKLDAKDNEEKVYRNIEKAKELNFEAPEMLFETSNKKYEPKLEKPAPLDKSLIEKEKIKPISLTEAINAEEQNLDNKFAKTVTNEPLESKEKVIVERDTSQEKAPNKFIQNIKPDLPSNNKDNLSAVEKVVTPAIFQNPQNMIVKEEEKQPEIKQESIVKEPQELITNLEIVNLEKTIKAIHNIKRLYTM